MANRRRSTSRQHRQPDIDRGCARRARLRGIRRREGRRHQLHQNRSVRIGAPRHPGQCPGTGHHRHRRADAAQPEGLSPRLAHAIPMARPGHVDEIASPAVFLLPIWRATSPGRRFTSTAEHRPPAGGATTRRRQTISSDPGSGGYFRQLPASIGSVTPVM